MRQAVKSYRKSSKGVIKMSELNITASQIQGEVPVTILHLNGHLHCNTEPQLLDCARQAQEDGSKHLLLDLSAVEVITSAGLRAIHNIFNLFTPQSDRALIKQHGDEPYKSPYFKLVEFLSDLGS